VQQRWTESRVGFKLGNLLFNMIGAVLLLIALGIGAVNAVDIPRALATGAFGQGIQADLFDAFGIKDWNVIASAALGVITLVSGTLSAVCLIFARRESSWSHMFRIPVAATAFVVSVLCLGTTMSFGDRWTGVAERVQDHVVDDAIRFVFVSEFWPGLIMGGLLFVVAVFVLAWPARRHNLVADGPAIQHQHRTRPQEHTVKG
jgi:hypothetical protein